MITDLQSLCLVRLDRFDLLALTANNLFCIKPICPLRKNGKG